MSRLIKIKRMYTFTGVPLDRIRRGIIRSQKDIRHRTRFQDRYN